MIEYLNLIDSENQNQCLEFLKFLESNCLMAKGSSFNHQSWKGGYLDHVNETFKYCLILYENLSIDRVLDFTISDALLVLFLHDIEKPIKYSNITDFGDDDNEIRSKLIEKFKFNLSIDHRTSLKYIHGEGNDYSKKERVMIPLCAFCHCCDVISSRIFFDYPKLNNKEF